MTTILDDAAVVAGCRPGTAVTTLGPKQAGRAESGWTCRPAPVSWPPIHRHNWPGSSGLAGTELYLLAHLPGLERPPG